MTHARCTERGRARWVGGGFTVVELLVVIAIIVLLLGVLVIGYTAVRESMRRSATQVMFKGIDLGLAAYRNDLGDYPPSTMPSPPRCMWWPDGPASWSENWQGAHWLAHAMLGLGDGPVDGKDGPGFRTQPRGDVYGPYIDADRARVEVRGAAEVLLDDGGNPILYYRRDPTTGEYNPAHNTLEPEMPDINAYVALGASGLSRHEYVICSAGPDRKWGEDRNNDGDLDGYGDDYNNLRD